MWFILIGLLTGSPDIVPRADTIYWCNGSRLSWTDFQWEKNKPSGALSSNHVYIKLEASDGKFQFRIFALFYPQKSWTNDTSKVLLEHEQLHFDIAELTARRIRKFLADKKITEVNVEETAKTIQSMIDFQKQTNRKFDDETYHGYFEQKQNKWKEFIRSNLEQLRDYEIKCDSLLRK